MPRDFKRVLAERALNSKEKTVAQLISTYSSRGIKHNTMGQADGFLKFNRDLPKKRECRRQNKKL